jgi:hypothetical protein
VWQRRRAGRLSRREHPAPAARSWPRLLSALPAPHPPPLPYRTVPPAGGAVPQQGRGAARRLPAVDHSGAPPRLPNWTAAGASPASRGSHRTRACCAAAAPRRPAAGPRSCAACVAPLPACR